MLELINEYRIAKGLPAREKDVPAEDEAWTPGKPKAKDRRARDPRSKVGTPKSRRTPSSPAELLTNFFEQLGTSDRQRNPKRDTDARPNQKDDTGVQLSRTDPGAHRTTQETA